MLVEQFFLEWLEGKGPGDRGKGVGGYRKYADRVILMIIMMIETSYYLSEMGLIRLTRKSCLHNLATYANQPQPDVAQKGFMNI